jgi:hypothetical protein
MTRDMKTAMVKEMVALMAERISVAAGHTRSAMALINGNHNERGFDILLDAEQPLHEARTLLNVISLLLRDGG